MRKLVVLVSMVATFVASVIFAVPAQAASPGWITSCNFVRTAPDDPIVFPDQPGAAHEHFFVGSRAVSAFTTTSESLRALGTLCATIGDDSAYWIPQPYEDGVALQPATRKHALFYYRQKAASGTTVVAFPEEFKLVLGNANANDPSENPLLGSNITFKCGPGSNTETPYPPAQCGSGVLVIVFILPNCYVGGTPHPGNDIDMMAYPDRGHCPASHPVVLPRIQAFWRFNVGTDPIDLTFAGKDAAGNHVQVPYYKVHMDFFNAWDPVSLQSLLDRCINGGVDCKKNPVP